MEHRGTSMGNYKRESAVISVLLLTMFTIFLFTRLGYKNGYNVDQLLDSESSATTNLNDGNAEVPYTTTGATPVPDSASPADTVTQATPDSSTPYSSQTKPDSTTSATPAPLNDPPAPDTTTSPTPSPAPDPVTPPPDTTTGPTPEPVPSPSPPTEEVEEEEEGFDSDSLMILLQTPLPGVMSLVIPGYLLLKLLY